MSRCFYGSPQPPEPIIPHEIQSMIVIGHFNRPEAVELNIAAIRYYNGDDIPILISDDCSDGFSARPNPKTLYGQLIEISLKFPNVFIWPTHFRIGHAGGDLAAFWKGLNWAGCGGWDGLNWRGNNGYDVLFKLSQRFIIMRHGWADYWATKLMQSKYSTLGTACCTHGFDLRTEAIGMKVGKWFTPQILAHLSPRPINIATEAVVFEVVEKYLEKEILNWDLLSKGRGVKANDYLFRGANSIAEYKELSMKLGLNIGPITVEDSNQTANYKLG